MKIKFNKKWIDSTNFMIVVSALAAMLSAFASLPSAGLISTFPLALFIAAATMLIVKELYYIPLSFFVMTYLFAFFDGSPAGFEGILGGYALRVALKVTLMSLLGCLAVVAIKDKNKIIRKKWLTVTVGVMLTLVGCAVCFFEGGTPWGFINANSTINETIEQRFDTNGVTVSNVYGIPGKGYACDISINHHDEIGLIKYDDGVLSETVTQLYAHKITNDSVTIMTETLRQYFIDASFEVKCKYVGSYKTKLSLKNPQTVSEALEYTIDIYSEETAKTFSSEAKQYFKAVSESGVACENLTVNGGVRRKMFYTAKGNPYIPESLRLEIYNNALMPNSIE